MVLPNSALIGEAAYQALLCEVNATPKPGLVDRANTGAHSDMDHTLFCKSAHALRPFFAQLAALGSQTAGLPQHTVLAQVRPLGLQAEAAMFHATQGVNTHKGAIFSLGLLCVAAGRRMALKQSFAPEAVCRQAGALVAGICQRELEKKKDAPSTKGERAFIQYGYRGVRGEAEDGFPHVWGVGLPAYQAALAQSENRNNALCTALLHLIAALPDTNVLTRLNLEAALYARQAAQDCLETISNEVPGSPLWLSALNALDQDFIARRISPGGCADLLACAWFLGELSQQN